MHLIARDRMLKAAYRVMGGGQGIAELNQVLAKNQATEAEQAAKASRPRRPALNSRSRSCRKKSKKPRTCSAKPG